MNPARDKRKRLFQAFNNKQNLNTTNFPARHVKSVYKPSHLSPGYSRASSCLSDPQQQKISKLKAQVHRLTHQNESYQSKLQYHDKMECFYLSELASLREKEERMRKRMTILLEQLPSNKEKQKEEYLCENCHYLGQQNLDLRGEIDLKNKVIGVLQNDLECKSIEIQVIKRHEDSVWREEGEEKQGTNTESRMTKESKQQQL